MEIRPLLSFLVLVAVRGVQADGINMLVVGEPDEMANSGGVREFREVTAGGRGF